MTAEVRRLPTKETPEQAAKRLVEESRAASGSVFNSAVFTLSEAHGWLNIVAELPNLPAGVRDRARRLAGHIRTETLTLQDLMEKAP